MATSKRIAAASRRALGAAQFSQDYDVLPDASMPAVAPAENTLRDEISLQQGQGQRNINAIDAVVYEKTGRGFNQQFAERHDQLHDQREGAIEIDALVELVRHLPPGFRISPEHNLNGLTVGEIVMAIQTGLGANTLRGLYLDATVVDLSLVGKQQGVDDEGSPLILFNQSMTNYYTRRLPLWQVKPILPRSEEYPHGFTGGTVDERTEGMENTMRILYGDVALSSVYEIDAEFSDDPDLAELGMGIGSDISTYYIVANARLVRRVRAPVYIDQRTSTIRTGGFSELLTETAHIEITLDEVVDAYVEHERLNTTDFTEGYVNDFRRVVGQLFTVDVFTMENRCITLIVPGGTEEVPRGGCCVDIATFNYLRNEYDVHRARVLMADVRDRFESLYLQWRCKKKASRKRTVRGESNPNPIYIPTPDEKRVMIRDLKSTTAHGYSSQVFKFFQIATHCVTGYLPCIYYHRIEKARDYNQGVRVRMVQVGGGVVGKELAAEHARESLVNSEMDDQAPFYSINMMRININGEIHRHRPKSLCIEETSEYIPDDDTTGLLHAISIYPGLPDDFFKGVNAKRREVLLSVIEKKTKALMSHCKKASVGLVPITPETMRDAVEEQLRRQDGGITQTLIYGGGNEQQRLAMSEQQPMPPPPPAATRAAARSSTSSSSTTPVYFSNCYDIEGRKIPDRPLVIAYDLETVELTADAVSSGKVGVEFLRENPDRSKYIECERQIPFCVSWVPVNLSDEGRHKTLKEAILEKGESCTPVRREEQWAGGWSGTDSFVYCSDGRRVREGYVMLSEVKVHYGKGILGRCIDEFIDSVVEWSMKRGYTSVHAYAHNGVGFDSYVVQAFNTKYEYNSILKTSRGILSMRMKVPFTTRNSQRKIFPITFLDTKVFLSFSLSKLCADFRVPDAWAKLDFPITKITWKNCYNKEVIEILEPYSINDTRALAYIIKQINRIVCLETEVVHIPGSDELPDDAYAALMDRVNLRGGVAAADDNVLKGIHPPTPNNPKPPIAQFCTIMSCVKRVAAEYMRRTRTEPTPSLTRLPSACDLPVVRHWVEMASMGGRVSPYAKMYSSSRWGLILSAYMKGDHSAVANIVKEAIAANDTAIVLDVTSLYPSAMAYCPMPMGSLRYLNALGCVEAINSIECETCEELMQICPLHRMTARPFVVVVIKGGLKRGDEWRTMNKKNPVRHLVGRKMKGKKERGGSGSSYKLPGSDVSGVIYTNESDEEMTKRYWGDKAFSPPVSESVLGVCQSYTNIDLYWALKSGFEFEIVGGYEWETSYELQPLILTLFKMRIAAKAEKNTCLQQAIKLLLNSLFGIHSQRVIRSVDKVLTLPETIREADVKEEEFARYIRANHQKIFDPRMKLKENIPLANGQSMVRAVIPGDIGEGVGGYSPNHIGCAVLAWSRHIMSLVMHQIPTGHLTYTDTDSLAVSESWYNNMMEVSRYGCTQYGLPALISPKGDKLMTYKNDHGDYFPNARVLFSAIGAKKVKMHIIGCPDTGQIQVCSTFKGFLRKDTLDNGDRLHPHHHEHTMAKALLDILYMGKPEAYQGTRWSRDMGADGGVTIERSVYVEGESYTYLGKHKGFAFTTLKDSPSTVLVCVPYGSDLQSLTTASGIIPNTIVYVKPVRTLKRETPSAAAAVMKVFSPPHHYAYSFPAGWERTLSAHMGGVTKKMMYDFIEQIFLKRKDLYKPPPPTESEATSGEKTWDEIISVFEKGEEEGRGGEENRHPFLFCENEDDMGDEENDEEFMMRMLEGRDDDEDDMFGETGSGDEELFFD